jgi:hypothetical protein
MRINQRIRKQVSIYNVNDLIHKLNILLKTIIILCKLFYTIIILFEAESFCNNNYHWFAKNG